MENPFFFSPPPPKLALLGKSDGHPQELPGPAGHHPRPGPVAPEEAQHQEAVKAGRSRVATPAPWSDDATAAFVKGGGIVMTIEQPVSRWMWFPVNGRPLLSIHPNATPAQTPTLDPVVHVPGIILMQTTSFLFGALILRSVEGSRLAHPAWSAYHRRI